MMKPLPSLSLASVDRHLKMSVAIMVVATTALGALCFGIPISDAVVAQGMFMADSFSKKVQHQTGGIVKKILVKDGDLVREGDLLVQLDPTLLKANLDIIVHELDQLQATEARIDAERANDQAIAFPYALGSKQDEATLTLIKGTVGEFEANQAARAGERAQLLERIHQFEMQVDGLNKQIAAKSREVVIIRSELDGVRQLYARGLVQQARLDSLEREDIKADGEIGQLRASIGEIGAKSAETKIQIVQIDREVTKSNEKDLEQNRRRVAELLEKKVAAEDQLQRLDIRAPHAGVVQELSVHTIGGVISPQGEPIMLIVPTSDKLIVEVRVMPNQIQELHPGQKALIRLSNLDQAKSPEMNATVDHVSADSIIDQRNGAAFFRVLLAVTKSEIDKARPVKVQPGMLCEVFLATGAPHSIASYFYKPISDQLMRAFR